MKQFIAKFSGQNILWIQVRVRVAFIEFVLELGLDLELHFRVRVKNATLTLNQTKQEQQQQCLNFHTLIKKGIFMEAWFSLQCSEFMSSPNQETLSWLFWFTNKQTKT